VAFVSLLLDGMTQQVEICKLGFKAVSYFNDLDSVCALRERLIDKLHGARVITEDHQATRPINQRGIIVSSPSNSLLSQR
jgi:hypothetical protein